jgi:opacity protein-like surface antigen
MKHIILTASIAILMSGSAFAQNEIKESKEAHALIIGVTGGFTSAWGNFTKTDYYYNKSGFAAGEYNLGITGTYIIKKHFGITALAGYQHFGIKGLQNLAAGYKEDFAIDSATVYAKGTNYAINLMAGPYYSITAGKHLFIDIRGLAGLVNAHLAGNKVDVENNVASSFEQKSATANTVGYQLGAAIRYQFSNHFGVMIDAAYYYSKPEFTVENINRANNAGRLITRYNEPIQGTNLNLSFIYQLSTAKSTKTI